MSGASHYRVPVDVLFEEGVVTTAALEWADRRPESAALPTTSHEVETATRALLASLVAAELAQLDEADVADEAAPATEAAIAWLIRARRALRRGVEDGHLAADATRALRKPRAERLAGTRDAVRLGLVELRTLGLDIGRPDLLSDGERVLAKLDALHERRVDAKAASAAARAAVRSAAADLTRLLKLLDRAGAEQTLTTGTTPPWATRRVLRDHTRAVAGRRRARAQGA